ncbi:MAG TPA: class I SAM-dependent methyltransferase [Acidobacteriaceae bacterium]|nr:class I SAM-dependent methyltransferase [Acidobacteriaceae bacterium]
MEAARPSHTALRVAMRRAAHQLFDDPPLVFTDPFAVRILGPHAAEIERTPGRNPAHKPRPFSVGLRAFLVARSRYAEELLAHAVANGATQYVILGAGLDTFALRNTNPSLRVFEVDHPATQAWKRDLLRDANLATPTKLTFVPVDFERESLATQLSASGFDSTQPTFFSWLGVVPYLTLEAFRTTISFIGAQPANSGLVFDYAQPRSALPHREQLAFDSLASRVHLAGESFQLFFTPHQAAAELSAFYNLEDLGTPELNALYFASRTDGLRTMGAAGRLVSGWL